MSTLPLEIHLGPLSASSDRTVGEPAGTAGSDAEAALIEAAKTDPAAFGPLFEAYYERVLTYAYRCTLNLAVAEEVTSNTFYSALRALRRLRRGVPFSAWVYRIATNEIRMHWRSQRRRRAKSIGPSCLDELKSVCFEPSALDSDEDRREKLRAYARLHERLSQLPERYRSVIMLRYFEGLPYEAIAQVLGKRLGTVKSLLHRALARLRTVLENDATFFPLRHVDG